MPTRILDLFCGAGGAAMGYFQAFGPDTEIHGIDHKPQPRYPFHFTQADALEFADAHMRDDFDMIHASPPCQRWSTITRHHADHPDLIAPLRPILQASGIPYVIENVPGAPLHNPIRLCGTMFDLLVIRHRHFETDPPIWWNPGPCRHTRPVVKHGRRPDPDRHCHGITGHFSDVAFARVAMDIDWMTQAELAQAIPPAYTKWIGQQLLAQGALGTVAAGTRSPYQHAPRNTEHGAPPCQSN